MFEKLNPRSAEIIKQSSTVYNLKWKRNIEFLLFGYENSGSGWYYILKNNEQISPTYHYSEINDVFLKNLQRIIDDIESGKYNNKKTPSEKIRLIVEERGLYSLMNNTKWKELISAIKEKIPNIPIKYKTLFEEEAPTNFGTMAGDEYFEYLNMVSIEWFKISCEIKEIKNRGRLIEDKVNIYGKKAEIYEILEKFNIPYEYDEIENAFIIYGYKS